MRKGFTLVEVMFATAISALVMAMLASVFVGIPLMIRRSYFETDLSVRMRALREKILFHAEQTHGGWVYAGLLAGGGNDGHFAVGNGKVKVQAQALKIAVGKSVKNEEAQLGEQTIELDREVPANAFGTELVRYGYFTNLGSAGSLMDYWLCLDRSGDAGVRNYLKDNSSEYLEDRLLKDYNLYSITLYAERETGFAPVVHKERIVVPVFGKMQEKNAVSVFHDNLLP